MQSVQINRTMRRLLVVLVTLAAVAAGARTEQAVIQQTAPERPAQPASEPTYWATHALLNVFRDTPPPPGDVGRLVLSAARNQAVGGQIVLRAGQKASTMGLPRCAGLRSEDGRSTIGAQAFRAAFVEYFRVEKSSTAAPPQELVRRAPDDFPDAFMEAPEVVVPAGMNQPVYVEFRVPPNTPPGLYRGVIRARVDDDELETLVELTVYDFDLPAPRLNVTVWVDTGALAKHQNVTPYSNEWWSLVDRVATLMRAHHQNVILTPWSLIRASRDENGQPVLDFERFDRWVRTFLGRGFRRIEISHIGGREHGQWEDKTFVSYDMPCEDGKGKALPIEEWLPMLQEHLKKQGWLQRAMIHVADEPIPLNLESWKQLSERVKKAAPELPRIDAVHVSDLLGHLEIWVPQLNFLEQWLPAFKAAQQKGAELWYYTAWVPQGRYPNRLMDFPLIKTRMLHWLNYTSGTTGYLHWGWNFWDVKFDQFAPGDNWIVWPGKTTPRSSLRYEAMREGIEDHEYLCLLEDALIAAAAASGASPEAARDIVLSYAHAVAPTFQDYSRDPARLYAVRDAVARSIESLKKPLPFAVLPLKAGAEADLRGFAPPGAVVAVGTVQTVAGDDGRFHLVASPEGNTVTITVSHDGRSIETTWPLIGG